jgi:glycosyltransferase involved in cell wall biosynthesis
METALSSSGPQIDVEFSLALHNRTGKFIVGRDIIEDCRDLIANQLFWRLRFSTPPNGLPAKVLGRLLSVEVDARVRSPAAARWLPKLRPPRPVLHLDPFTVTLHRLSASDVVLCHDVGPLTHPAFFAPSVTALCERAYSEIAGARPHMIFVSRASQDAFHGLFPGPFASTAVIHNSVRPELVEGHPSPVDGLGPAFLLTVGNVGARKNQLACVKAFARSGLAGRGVQYVLCGGREPGFDEVAAAAAATSGVRIMGFVSDAELSWLYANARGFVLLSRLEGFGIPVAEAIARGQIPLIGMDAALVEVAGEGAIVVDPEDEAAIADGMQQVVALSPQDRTDRLRGMQAGLARFDRATFQRSWRDALVRVAASAG